ncbi:MAG TPA: large conductance mechanosensitive channel protein MscL [Puia sp.]|jgi:large conductance mechanosensitive channel|nr:large conductance mechanosensitive channel protein MscL [Puia sp.]
MSMLKEFKDFIMRGNVIDLAVAVVIGAAFGAIVSSLVEHVITPLLLAPALKAAHLDDIDKLSWGAVKYGNFLSAVIKFAIIAFILFLIVKFIKALEKKKVPPASGPTLTETLLTEIRDELKKRPVTSDRPDMPDMPGRA